MVRKSCGVVLCGWQWDCAKMLVDAVPGDDATIGEQGWSGINKILTISGTTAMPLFTNRPDRCDDLRGCREQRMQVHRRVEVNALAILCRVSEVFFCCLVLSTLFSPFCFRRSCLYIHWSTQSCHYPKTVLHQSFLIRLSCVISHPSLPCYLAASHIRTATYNFFFGHLRKADSALKSMVTDLLPPGAPNT